MQVTVGLKRSWCMSLLALAAGLIIASAASASPGRTGAAPTTVRPPGCAPTAPHARPMGIACTLKGQIATLPSGSHVLVLKIPRKYIALRMVCTHDSRLGIACTVKQATTISATGTRTVKIAIPASWVALNISCSRNARLGITCRAHSK
jgi:hypothetical protein